MEQHKNKRVYKGFLILIFILIIAWFTYSYFSQGFFYQLFQEDPQGLINKIGNYGVWSYFIFVLLIILECVLAPFPPLILYIAGGAIFGSFLGGVLALVGNFIGAAIAFLIANKFGREWIQKQIPKKILERIDKFSERHGPASIFILRINPLTSSDLLSYAAGLTKMNFKKFLFWTVLALVPTIFLQTYLGEKITQSPFLTELSIVAGAIYLIGFFVFYFWFRKKSKRRSSAQKD